MIFFSNYFRYSFLIAAFSFLSFINVNAQIIYKDANPDISVSAVFNIDLDSNGVNEFAFNNFVFMQSASIGTGSSYITTLSNDTNGIVNPPSLFLDDLIDSSRTYDTNNSYQLSGCSWDWANNSYNSWSIGNNGYLGVRFLIDNQIHYGWIRLNIGCHSITIYDWAYNSQPDSAITAGQVWLGINSTSSATSFASVIAINHSVIVNLNENAKATISIYNGLGQLITKNENASGEMKLDMENINPGIYFVEVVEGEKFYSKKIYLQ